jgi:hypothetical protein
VVFSEESFPPSPNHSEAGKLHPWVPLEFVGWTEPESSWLLLSRSWTSTGLSGSNPDIGRPSIHTVNHLLRVVDAIRGTSLDLWLSFVLTYGRLPPGSVKVIEGP